MKKLVFLSILFIGSLAYGDRWYFVGEENGKAVSFSMIERHGEHILGPGEYPVTEVFPKHVPLKYWKKVGNKWREMNANEKAAVDDVKKQSASDPDKKDEFIRALVLVVAEELGLTPAQMRKKIKQKIRADKLKEKK